MDIQTIQEMLKKHRNWINNQAGGERAVFDGQNLRGVNLEYANLRYTILTGADLSCSSLLGADLQGASITNANLAGANIDFSCWPLWCGSRGVKVDKRIAAQLAAHFCALDCDDPEYIKARDSILEFARTSYRARNLGLFKDEYKEDYKEN